MPQIDQERRYSANTVSNIIQIKSHKSRKNDFFGGMICILYAVISKPRQRLLGIVELFLLNRFRGETGRSEEDRGE